MSASIRTLIVSHDASSGVDFHNIKNQQLETAFLTFFDETGVGLVGRRWWRQNERVRYGAGFTVAVDVLGSHTKQKRLLHLQVVNHIGRRVTPADICCS